MIDIIIRHTIPAALSLLPPKMSGKNAECMLAAIGLQESSLRHRHQMGGGPAHGLWMFEPIGVQDVMEQPSTRDHFLTALDILEYPEMDVEAVFSAIEHNDHLACVIARLALYLHPAALPMPFDGGKDIAWQIYVEKWQPGIKRPEHWELNWQKAEQMTVHPSTIRELHPVDAMGR